MADAIVARDDEIGRQVETEAVLDDAGPAAQASSQLDWLGDWPESAVQDHVTLIGLERHAAIGAQPDARAERLQVACLWSPAERDDFDGDSPA